MIWHSLPQDYVYPDAKDRQFLQFFYKGIKKQKFNVGKYNALKDELASVHHFLMKVLKLAVLIVIIFLIFVCLSFVCFYHAG